MQCHAHASGLRPWHVIFSAYSCMSYLLSTSYSDEMKAVFISGKWQRFWDNWLILTDKRPFRRHLFVVNSQSCIVWVARTVLFHVSNNFRCVSLLSYVLDRVNNPDYNRCTEYDHLMMCGSLNFIVHLLNSLKFVESCHFYNGLIYQSHIGSSDV